MSMWKCCVFESEVRECPFHHTVRLPQEDGRERSQRWEASSVCCCCDSCARDKLRRSTRGLEVGLDNVVTQICLSCCENTIGHEFAHRSGGKTCLCVQCYSIPVDNFVGQTQRHDTQTTSRVWLAGTGASVRSVPSTSEVAALLLTVSASRAQSKQKPAVAPWLTKKFEASQRARSRILFFYRLRGSSRSTLHLKIKLEQPGEPAEFTKTLSSPDGICV